jgi:hypothetical protein
MSRISICAQPYCGPAMSAQVPVPWAYYGV